MYCLKAQRVNTESINDVGCVHEKEVEYTPKSVVKSMDINAAHDFCHLGEKLCVTFSSLGIKLTGTMLP